MTRTARALALLTPLALPALALAQPVPQLWETNCASCHGTDAKGGGAGAQSLLDTQREWLGGQSNRDLFNSIKLGLKDHGMPAYGEALKDNQIWGCVVWIRELQAQAARPKRTPAKSEALARDSMHATYRVEDVIEDGLQVPWALDWLPDGFLLVTERPGRLRTFKDGVLSEPIKGTPSVRNRGQGGLMDVAVHPEYATSGWVYLSFSDKLPAEGRRIPGMTKIVRGKIKDGAWVDEQTIFKADDKFYLPSDIHFGCHIVFERAKDGKYYVFFGIGERGYGHFAQDLARPNGKVHRLWDDGAVPDDNPFLSTKDAMPSVWSLGHRNPQGLSFDLEGRLWDTEHGPRGGDELNLVEKAHNYGWPIVSFGMDYSGMPLRNPLGSGTIDTVPFPDLVLPENKPAQDITMPVFVWLPSIAASGLDVVRAGEQGEAFPGWKGDLVLGGLAGQTVQRVRIAEGQVAEREILLQGFGRVRDVAVGPDGAVYVALNDPDKVVRLVPVKKPATGEASPAATPAPAPSPAPSK